MRPFIFGFALAVLLLLVNVLPVALPSGTRSDGAGNDTFATASELVYTTEAQSGTLNATDTIDFYRVRDLIGDNANDQMAAQLLELRVRSTGGGDVEAKVFEPNELGIATLRSSGEWARVEFVVPYDGDYFLNITTVPPGEDATYEFAMGGELDYDARPYSKNNWPGEFIFAESRKVSLTLNPVKNIVDYYTIDLQPGWGLEALFQSDFPMHLSVLTSSFDEFGSTDGAEPIQVRNTGTAPMRVHVRMDYPLFGNLTYEPTSKPYDLNLVVWSFLTEPVIEGAWPSVITMDEDPGVPLVMNLSQHFVEANGDPLDFQVMTHHEGLIVTLDNVTTSWGDPLYTQVTIMPRPNWFGEEDVSFRCWDRDNSLTDGFKVKVDPVNDLPVVSRIGGAIYTGLTFNMGVWEDEVRTFTVECSDADDDIGELSFSIDTTIYFMDVDPHNGTMTLHPQQKNVGTFVFHLVILDPSGGKVEVPINLTVQPVNDRPLVPLWERVAGNLTAILPGEPITLKVSPLSPPDPDGNDLTYTWIWGDGTTSTGTEATHVFEEGYYGGRAVILKASDGLLTNETQIPIYLKSPEDIAIGDLKRIVPDPSHDCVEFREETTRPEGKEVVTFRVVNTEDLDGDIVSVLSVRRGNQVQVTIEVAGSIQTDGTYHYTVYLVPSGWTEPVLEVNATKAWSDIPPMGPNASIYGRMSYMGEVEVNSTGTISNGKDIVFTFDIMDLNAAGAALPLNRTDLGIIAVSEHFIQNAVGKATMRSIVYDSAGDGVAAAPRIEPPSSGGGGTSSPIGDFAKGPGIFVLLALFIIMLVLGTIGFVLVRRENRKKKDEEERFVKEVEKMRAEGKDLFGHVKEEGSKQVSYEELYGKEPPGDYKPSSDVPQSALPGPGLAGAGIGQGTSAPPTKIDGQVAWEE